MDPFNRQLGDQASIDTILCPIHQNPIYFIDVEPRTQQGQRAKCRFCKVDKSISLEDFKVKWNEHRKPLSDFKNSQTLNYLKKQMADLNKQLERMKKQYDSLTEQVEKTNQEIMNHIDIIQDFDEKKIGKLNQFKSRSDYEEVAQMLAKKQICTKVISEVKDIEKIIFKFTNSITELYKNQSKILDQIMKEFSSEWNMKKLETAEKIFFENCAEKSYEDKLSKINLSIKLYPPKPQVSLFKRNLIKGNTLFHINYRNQTVECNHNEISFRNNQIKFEDCLFYKCRLLKHLGLHDEFLKCIEEAKKICQIFSEPLKYKLITLMNYEKYIEVIECAQEIININPLSNKWHIIKCEALLIIGRDEEALKIVTELIQNGKKDPEIYELMSRILTSQKDYILAIHYLNKAIQLNPNNANLYYQKGVALLKSQSPTEALRVFKTSARLGMPALEVLNAQGEALLSLKKFSEAVQVFEEIIQIDLLNCEAYILKAFTLFEIGQHEKANECYDNAIIINPNFGPAFYFRGIILFQQQQFCQALQYFDKTIKFWPDLIDTFFFKGLTLFNLGNYQNAIEICDDLIERDQKDPLPLFLKAIFLTFHQNNYEFKLEAETCIQQATQINPQLRELYEKWFILGRKNQLTETHCKDGRSDYINLEDFQTIYHSTQNYETENKIENHNDNSRNIINKITKKILNFKGYKVLF